MKKTKKKIVFKILILMIIICIMAGVTIISINFYRNEEENEANDNNRVQKEEQYEIKEYEIQGTSSVEFENAQIKIDRDISYIQIKLTNISGNTIKAQEIDVKLYSEIGEMSLPYKLPQIEKDSSYQIALMITKDLSDVVKIEVII